ncbi:MAG: site-specific DNA-methyltransferase [Desulfuromonadales bacterium]|nr:site-specific DNA-methyltransferase [Desulfuromonadales bacterium]
MTSRPWSKLLHGDCRQLLTQLADDSVDLVLTDPPYNISDYSTGNMSFKWRPAINNDLAGWDRQFDPDQIREQLLRVLKPTGNLFAFCSYNTIGRWHELFDPVFDTFQFFVWHKSNPVPKVRRQGFLNSCELIVCMWNRGHTWNFGRQSGMHNFFEGPICMAPERLKEPKHPTQKPVRLLKHLIGIASNPGDTILDPFMGVGSTGAAAGELQRNFIGMELDESYFLAARQRLAATGCETVFKEN